MICVPLKAKSGKELIALIKKAEKKGAQAVEIWLDNTGKARNAGAVHGAEDVDMLAAIRKATKLPLIFVNKPKREKGKWTGSEERRIEILKNAVAAGADYIDIGIDTNSKLIRNVNASLALNRNMSESSGKHGRQNAARDGTARRQHAKLILSYHNFTATPHIATLKSTFKKMRTYKPDVYKFAVTPKSPKDTIHMLEFLEWIRAELGTGQSAGKVREGYVIICMGRYGEFLRQISENLGNEFTYVALDENHKTAPGQQIMMDTLP